MTDSRARTRAAFYGFWTGIGFAFAGIAAGLFEYRVVQLFCYIVFITGVFSVSLLPDKPEWPKF